MTKVWSFRPMLICGIVCHHIGNRWNILSPQCPLPIAYLFTLNACFPSERCHPRYLQVCSCLRLRSRDRWSACLLLVCKAFPWVAHKISSPWVQVFGRWLKQAVDRFFSWPCKIREKRKNTLMTFVSARTVTLKNVHLMTPKNEHFGPLLANCAHKQQDWRTCL